MANVATTIEMDPTYRPFERPPDPQALWSVVPRGLRGFVVPFSIIDAKPVNDTQTLTLNGQLPPNYAYIFAAIGMRIAQDRLRDWTDVYTMNLQSWYEGRTAISMSWNFSRGDSGLVINESTNESPLRTVPNQPMWAPATSSGIQIIISTFNDAATVAGAGNVSFFMNFWEFDLEQVRKFPINTPFPTHSR